MSTRTESHAGVSTSHPAAETTVSAGQVYDLYGSVAAGSTLTVDGGDNTERTGGELAVKGVAANDGTIDLLGGVFTTTTSGSESGALMLVTGSFTSYGDLAVQAGYGSSSNGQLTDHGVVTNDGIMQIYGGVGGTSFSPGGEILVYGVLNNNGTMDLFGATSVNGNAGYQGGLRMLGPSTFDNTGLVDIYGAVGAVGGRVALAGTLTNSGTILAQGGTQLKGSPELGQDGPAAVVDIGSSTLNNSGTIALDGGQSNGGPGVGAGTTLFQARQNSTLNTGLIALGGAFAAATATYGSITGARFVQYGTIVNDGSMVVDAGETTIGSGATAEGALFIDSHGLLQNNTSMTVEGTQAVADIAPSQAEAGTLAENGVLTNVGTLLLGGGASADTAVAGFGALLNVYGQQNVYGTGHLVNDGLLVVGGGYREAGGKAGGGARLEVTGGSLENSGQISLQAGSQAASSTHALATAAQYGDGASLRIVAGGLINTGTISAGAVNAVGGSAVITDYAKLTNEGLISLAAVAGSSGIGASMTIESAGTLVDSGTVSGGGVLTNDGVISTSASLKGTGLISASQMVNNGSLLIGSGTSFVVDAAVSATSGSDGTIALKQSSSVTLAGAVTNQSVSFGAANETLAIGDAAGFGGVLDGLIVKDTLDFLGLDVTSAVASGETLDIGLNTGATFDIALGASLGSNVGITLGSDNNGGTDVHFVAMAS